MGRATVKAQRKQQKHSTKFSSRQRYTLVPFASPNTIYGDVNNSESSIKIAAGITCAKRPIPTIFDSLESCRAAGFSPTIHTEPESIPGYSKKYEGVQSINYTPTKKFNKTATPESKSAVTIFRKERLGAFENFKATLRELLGLHPTANAIAVFQDDVLYAKEIKQLLENQLWPSENTGVVSIYCPNKKEYRFEENQSTTNKPAAYQIHTDYIVAAQTYIFPRKIAQAILEHPLCDTWKGYGKNPLPKGELKKAIDGFITAVLKDLKKEVWFYSPSLCQHYEPIQTNIVSPTSSNSSLIGHGKHEGFRRAYNFIGEEKSALEECSKQHVTFTNRGKQRFNIINPRTENPVDAIIPGINCSNITIQCLANVFIGNTERLGKIYYIDNGSDEFELEQIEDSIPSQLQSKINIIENPENYGFSRAVNQGINQSNNDVLILNNDCNLSSKTISILRDQLYWHPRNGAIGPITCDQGSNSLIQHWNLTHLSKQPKPQDINNTLGWSVTKRFQEPNTRIHYVQQLPFFCTLLRREAIEDVGLLNEEKFRDGLAADDDWCHRATKKGWNCLLTFSTFAEHKHKYTFKALGIDRIEKLKEANTKLRG
tara:strand:+ start:2849 stop:4645 length:1797 start_codon:yes stop_codon:yes gene_type:complete